MSKRAASRDPVGSVSKLLKTIDDEQKDGDVEDEEDEAGSRIELKYSLIVYFLLK